MPTTVWGNIVFSVAPTILVGLLFWFVMRAIVRADRTERKVHARIEAEERAKRAGATPAAAPTSTSAASASAKSVTGATRR